MGRPVVPQILLWQSRVIVEQPACRVKVEGPAGSLPKACGHRCAPEEPQHILRAEDGSFVIVARTKGFRDPRHK